METKAHTLPPRLLTEKDVAQALSLSVRTIQAFRLRGGGPRFIKIGSRAVRYRPEDVSAFLIDAARTSTSDLGGAQ